MKDDNMERVAELVVYLLIGIGMVLLLLLATWCAAYLLEGIRNVN